MSSEMKCEKDDDPVSMDSDMSSLSNGRALELQMA